MRTKVSRWFAGCLLLLCVPYFGGCGTAASLVVSAAGIATDHSVTWDVLKHMHAKLTEGDDVPCSRLDSVQRALNVRCGAFEPGSVLVADVIRPRLQDCALSAAVRDPRFWPALPEFIARGASPEACARSPLVELAQSQACPDFSKASPAVLQSMRWLAEADARAIHHDVVRMLSCPNAVRAGLDASLGVWLAQGALDHDKVSFGPLGALHPERLNSPFARALEALGHTAREGLGGFDGVQPRSFELALRESDWVALDWWLTRVPELANRVPPTQGNQLAWVPLAKVLTPNFLSRAETRGDAVEFLLARGANPWQKLPFDAGKSVVEYARSMKSPQLVLLDPSLAPAPAAPAVPSVLTVPTVIATGETASAR